MSADGQDPITVAVRQLLQSVQTLQLATLSDASVPLASYAPFIHEPGQGFFIFVSELARHTPNMRRRPQVSAMIITAEAASRRIFARERLGFECTAEFIARDHADWVRHLESFEARFGAVLKLLKGLEDFHLIVLKPLRGVYVRGFGEAWSFEGPALEHFTHIDSQRLAPDRGADTG